MKGERLMRDPNNEKKIPKEPVMIIGETQGRGDTDDFPNPKPVGPDEIKLADLLDGDLFHS